MSNKSVDFDLMGYAERLPAYGLQKVRSGKRILVKCRVCVPESVPGVFGRLELVVRLLKVLKPTTGLEPVTY